ncbi:MAG: hypothetical protein KDC79_11755 [Cyclobacteriaceae bacterium]|nr:hypothetical protein [Cyclobacteriaceae bacterium]
MLKNNARILLMFLSSIVIVGLISSCNKTIEPDLSDFGYEYFPIEIGQYRTYYSMRIDYNLDGSIDTTQYLTKEIVEDTVVYSDGSKRYLLGRYSANIGSDNWQKDSLWTAMVSESNVVISEGNIDFIKLAFPVKSALKWDGNARNNRTEELYEISDLEAPYSYDTLSFSNTLTVIQADLIDPAKLTEDDYRIEVYAKGVGLVHKLKMRINYCDPTKCSENGTIEDGEVFEQKLIEFGEE